MKTYNVTYRVKGFFSVELEADSAEEAEAKAFRMIEEADFGPLSDIDWSKTSTELIRSGDVIYG